MATVLRGSDNFDSASGFNSVGTLKAWVSFNGQGTVAIRASGNVSSITDHGTGQYTVSFTTAMLDGNYSVSGVVSRETTAAPAMITPYTLGTQSTSSFRYSGRHVVNGLVDGAVQCIAIFR